MYLRVAKTRDEEDDEDEVVYSFSLVLLNEFVREEWPQVEAVRGTLITDDNILLLLLLVLIECC